MKTLTPEQQKAKEERHAKFRELWKQVAAMPDLARVQMANKLGLRTCEGHELSLANTMLVALQIPTASVVGGFRQWLKTGRAVRKGQHGAMIWVPTKPAKDHTADEAPIDLTADEGEKGKRHNFIIGTVFDIGQTEELTVKQGE